MPWQASTSLFMVTRVSVSVSVCCARIRCKRFALTATINSFGPCVSKRVLPCISSVFWFKTIKLLSSMSLTRSCADDETVWVGRKISASQFLYQLHQLLSVVLLPPPCSHKDCLITRFAGIVSTRSHDVVLIRLSWIPTSDPWQWRNTCATVDKLVSELSVEADAAARPTVWQCGWRPARRLRTNWNWRQNEAAAGCWKHGIYLILILH